MTLNQLIALHDSPALTLYRRALASDAAEVLQAPAYRDLAAAQERAVAAFAEAALRASIDEYEAATAAALTGKALDASFLRSEMDEALASATVLAQFRQYTTTSRCSKADADDLRERRRTTDAYLGAGGDAKKKLAARAEHHARVEGGAAAAAAARAPTVLVDALPRVVERAAAQPRPRRRAAG